MRRDRSESHSSCPRLELLEARRLLSALPWGPFPKLIGQDKAATDFPYLNGAGESIAVIDTGIDYKHPSLGGGIGPGLKIEAGYAFDTRSDDPFDTDGHGTGVAGILAADPFSLDGFYYQGVAPKINLIDLRQNSSATIEEALGWVITHRVQYNIVAVNITDFPGISHDPGVYALQLQQLHDAGVFIAAPAGNNGATTPISLPAADPNVYSAGAVDVHDQIAANTQRGSNLDVLGPGVDVTLTYYNVRKKRSYYLNYGTGTSWAAPYLTGTAALLKEVDPTLTPDQIMSIIQQSGKPIFDPLSQRTYARLDIGAAIQLAYAQRDDAFQGNTTFAHAAPLTLTNGNVSVGGLKLLLGHDDYYSFTVDSTQDVTFHVTYQNPPTAPATAQLMDANGKVIAPLGATTLEHLAVGTYVLHFSSAQSLDGTYGFSVLDAPGAAGQSTPGTYNSLARGADGTLYLAFFDPVSQTLQIETSTGGNWSPPTTIDSTVGAGYYVSLALDKNGLPGVAYYNASAADLRFAHFNGSVWIVQTVDSQGSVGDYPSLAYTGLDPVITYHSAAHHALEFAAFSGGRRGKWTLNTIDSKGDPGYYSSVALDPVHGGWSVAYENNADGSFEYATQAKGKWKIVKVDANHRGGGYVSLAYNAAGQPAFSYYDAADRSLEFAQAGTSGWSTTIVQDGRRGAVGQYSHLFFTPSGNAEILYYAARTGSVFAAVGNAGGWRVSTLESAGGAFISLASGPGAGTAFAWLDAETGQLRVDDF